MIGPAAPTPRDSGPRALGGRRLRRGRRMAGGLNNTAMTDVIFILLVFFVSVSQVRSSSMELELPRVAARASEASRESPALVVIDIDREGNVFVDGAAHAPAEIGAVAKRHGKAVRVRIRADAAVRNGIVMQVIASLAQVGIDAIEFAVETEGGA
ncbi:MAG: biopolymer transporter ExbD [Planctomycetota bacterium]|nr:MAG: biopolymer transporter ExbD [Planctomycetota bacterium]